MRAATPGSIEIETSFTPKSLNEAGRQSRRWYAWPVFVLQDAYGIMLVGALLWVVIAGLTSFVRGTQRSPKELIVSAAILVVLIAVFSWSFLSTAKRRRELLAKINPLKLTFSSLGITSLEPNGASTFAPWSAYADFRECRYIFRLRTADGRGYRAIPKDALPEIAAEQVRSVLLSKLPETR